ncbi:hypothetical protein CQA53_00010 [Helicobacter didelphidarum]|uniref:Dynamin N-terminal domain-containing protein n=1 Tax=Helicobacter didelphidarum TaxID=2040648 RepID=A0A3D8IQS2_9HELI|nr:dynamin family protein [Helicobacter didelphidarum]RDU67453.1 hypothetical protein CQA53_00010 [Helicobacter didelphidarum]
MYSVEFYKSLESLNVRNKNIDEKRDEIKKQIDDFHNKIDTIKINENIKDIDEELIRVFREYQNNTKEKISIWKQLFDKKSKEAKFEDELRNNFIVIIYGKVKAGKSTLGNYIAKNCLPHQKPKFTKYDKAGQYEASEFEEIDENEGFKTKITECTSEIQLFKLGGLAWVDTPGLSSMTEANGELARKYITKADFIIFPTSSDSPLQNDEIKQIKELIKLGKTINIIITKSDRTEEDEVDGKIVKIFYNKSEENRKLQQEDIYQRLKENIKSDINKIDNKIFSISIKAAKESKINDNQELYNGSNIEYLYEVLDDLVKNKAEKLKAKNPYITLAGLIDIITNGVNGSENEKSLCTIKKEFENIKGAIQCTQHECNKAKERLQNQIPQIIQEITYKYYDEIGKQGIEQKLLQEVEYSILKLANKEIREVMNNFNANTSSIQSLKINFNIETFYEDYIKEASWWNKFLHTVSFGVFGEEDTKERRVAGDNKSEVIAKLEQTLISHYCDGFVSDCLKQIDKDFLSQLKDLMLNVETGINDLESTLKTLKNKLVKEAK